ncbi:FCD domain-containing protein [Rhodobacteraceae bacterium 2CG4]|uniref:FCD domain-containing protein n=1 Tax=Halovulum marinum TaxID=2662447 RepID=A0A6L5Z2I6_9RHOB|nr:FadR/GntR family transcriptional regulator [Halovulum marinum]MSU90295.1 FCD domain-containing protein [Halovulum marinum]
MNELINQYSASEPPAPAAGGHGRDVVDALRDLIAGGGYQPGDRLPPERELTERFGIKRAALRKALETLERDGLIWRHVGKGTFVSSARGGTPVASLAELSRQVGPLQMMRARLSMEPAIAREAAVNATAEAVARIENAREGAFAAASWDDYEACDDVFHRAIAEATGNALLLALFDQLNHVRRAIAWDTVVRTSERPPRDHTSFTEHDRIVAAIQTRNPVEAHAAMRTHLGSVSARLFGEV